MAEQGYALYQHLFPESVRPFIAQSKALYIVPTGPLHALPFEALVTETPQAGKRPQYLIKDHPITYLSSASLLKTLRDTQTRRKHTAKYPLLAFANPVYTDEQNKKIVETASAQEETTLVAHLSTIREMRSKKYLTFMGGTQYQELPQSEEQAKAIAAILKAPEKSEPLQLRERASRSNVLLLNEHKRLYDYRYLLFSAHAILPGEVDHIKQPAIVLSHPEKEGYFTMADIFGLQLNADLVVLSACNSGIGEYIPGEGIMGLTRAFMYAGTPAVSVTLWKVESKAASEIYTRFFEHLHTGDSLAVALQQAKLTLLNEAEEDSDLKLFRHPFFWAPFVVFGDGR
jgi:CHAT domain-containing protein